MCNAVADWLSVCPVAQHLWVRVLVRWSLCQTLEQVLQAQMFVVTVTYPVKYTNISSVFEGPFETAAR